MAKSAKQVLKNVIDGTLIYCKLPPTYIEADDGEVWRSNDIEYLKKQKNLKKEQ